MKKIALVFAISLASFSHAQTGSNSQNSKNQLKFQQGQSMDVVLNIKTTVSQVVMGQSIDFNVDGTALHNYKVTNATNDNTTLHHSVKRLRFNFDGMGQKFPFDTDQPKDLDGPLGKPFKETLSKTYDMVIDPYGKVLMVQPEKIQAAEMDDRMKLIATLLKDVLDVVHPPQKDQRSFFKILPDQELARGINWTETFENEVGKFSTTYTLSDITDSTILVGLAGSSTTTSKLEIMGGMEIITTMNNKTTGTITIDKATGIIKEQVNSIESNGTAQGMGSETPITSKSTVTIKVAF